MGHVSYSNRDYFERNIGTYIPSSFSTADAEPFRSNATKWPWPTVDDAKEWATTAGHPDLVGTDSTNVRAFEIALAAAIDLIAERCLLLVHPVDAAGDALALDHPDYEPVLIPPRVHLATVIAAHHLYRRRDSPEGQYGSGDLGGVLRVGGVDYDIELLLGNLVCWGLA